MRVRIVLLSLIIVLIYSFGLYLFVPKIFAGGSSFAQNEQIQREVKIQPSISVEISKAPVVGQVNNIAPDAKRINWPELLLGSFIGWALGLFSVLVVDRLKEPNLVFEVGSVGEDNVNEWRFVHIRIKNLKRKYRFSPFTASPAFACKALIKIDSKSFVGRWASKEQPIGDLPNIVNLALVHPREDIHPYTLEQEAVEVPIGIKYESEDMFYGFNNESYLPTNKGYRNKEYEFDKGIFEGELTISTLGKTYPKKFRIHNGSRNRKDFWLELKQK